MPNDIRSFFSSGASKQNKNTTPLKRKAGVEIDHDDGEVSAQPSSSKKSKCHSSGEATTSKQDKTISKKTTSTPKVKKQELPSALDKASKIMKTPKKPEKFSELDTPLKTPKSPETLTLQTPEQKRRESFKQFMHREGPKAIGSVDIPQGARGCFNGMTFVLSGVVETIDRDGCKKLIESLGGKVTGNVSGRTTYLLAGRDAGESKIAKAKSHGTSIINDLELYDLIRDKSENMPTLVTKDSLKNKQKKKLKEKNSPSSAEKKQMAKCQTTDQKTKVEYSVKRSLLPMDQKKPQPENIINVKHLTLVDKYRPTRIAEIVGQHGTSSAVNKLICWLRSWWKNNNDPNAPKKSKPAPWIKNDDGAAFKAVLLSGQPGIGKTTSAHVVCKELGFSCIELNASDARNKKSLEQKIESSSNALDCYMQQHQWKAPDQHTTHHVLIMDEVDGMSGNQDRAGIGELITLIKKTKIPIICICNDRQSQKIRSLANHCFDLRFNKPRNEQVKTLLQNICAKEKLQLDSMTLDQIITGANADIRQCIEHLNFLAADESFHLQSGTSVNLTAGKDITMNIFQAASQLISTGSSNLSLIKRSDLFFVDYQLMELFVFENYLKINPKKSSGESPMNVKRYARAARSMVIGNQCNRAIHSTQNWTLLPDQAMFSAVLPSYYLNGYLSAMIQFPSWLGKNSTRNKRLRLLQQLREHLIISTPTDTTTLQLDYLPRFRDALTRPLLNQDPDCVNKVLQLHEHYALTRDDADIIVNELTNWPGVAKDVTKAIDSKVKAQLTRAYNKSVKFMPYELGLEDMVKGLLRRGKKKTATGPTQDQDLDEEGNPIKGDDDANLEADDDCEDQIVLAQPKKANAMKGTNAKQRAADKTKNSGKAVHGRKK